MEENTFFFLFGTDAISNLYLFKCWKTEVAPITFLSETVYV